MSTESRSCGWDFSRPYFAHGAERVAPVNLLCLSSPFFRMSSDCAPLMSSEACEDSLVGRFIIPSLLPRVFPP